MTRVANGDFYGVALTRGPQGDFFRFRTNGVPAVEFPWGTNLDYGFTLNGDLAYDGVETLYGATTQGGSNHLGSVFRLTTNGVFTTLFHFNGTNGSYPTRSVTFGKDGNLYGTTLWGGMGFAGDLQSGYGTVFKLTTNGTLTTLAFFGATNGARPVASLTYASDGYLYGATSGGGTFGSGTLFRVTTSGALTTLASFDGTNGAGPISGLTQVPSGEFYGLTALGPDNPNASWGSFGTLFRVTTNGVITTIANFNGANLINPYPSADLCLAQDGNLYGLAADFVHGLSLNGNAGIFFRLAQVPQITTQSISNGTVILHWAAFTNGVYRVERKSGVWSNNWVALVPNVTAPGGTASFTDSSPLPGGSYYRVVLLP